MALGHKTGGRTAGTPNQKTKEVAELLASLGHDPIEAMVTIARNPRASLQLRGRINAELAQYIYPKRKAVELSGEYSMRLPELEARLLAGRKRARGE
jgi:hypothetical protein